MAAYSVSAGIIWFSLFFVFFLMISIAWIFIYFFRKYNKDNIITLDKTDRFKLNYVNISNNKKVDIDGGSYFLNEDAGKLNNKGKALFIFSHGKPTPLKIEYNKMSWLDSNTLMPIINNELVKQIVKPVEPIKDLIIMLGAIGGIIAGISAVVILLLQLGVIGGA